MRFIIVFLSMVVFVSMAWANATDDLKLKLAQAETRIAVLNQDKMNLQHVIDALRARPPAAIVPALIPTLVTDPKAQTEAAVNQASSQTTAQVNALAAQTSAKEAAITAEAQRNQTTTLLIMQSFGFLTLLTGFAYKAYTDHRERVWAKEDRKAHTEQIIGKLDGVQRAADNAYVEANTVNQKIAAIGLEMKDGSKPEANKPAGGQ